MGPTRVSLQVAVCFLERECRHWNECQVQTSFLPRPVGFIVRMNHFVYTRLLTPSSPSPLPPPFPPLPVHATLPAVRPLCGRGWGVDEPRATRTQWPTPSCWIASPGGRSVPLFKHTLWVGGCSCACLEGGILQLAEPERIDSIPFPSFGAYTMFPVPKDAHNEVPIMMCL